MTPSLAFPLEYKQCVSFASVKKNDHYLSIKENKLFLIPYKETNDFKLASTFCLYPEDTFFAQTNHGFFVTSFNKQYHLTHHVTNNLFMDRSLYLEKNNEQTNNIKKLLQLKKANQNELPKIFSVKAFNGKTSYFKLNTKKDYTVLKYLLPDYLYFQKVVISINHFDLNTNKINFNKNIYKNSRLFIQRHNLHATTEKASSTEMSFIIIPSLDTHKNKECISIASFNLRNYFLVDENKVLKLKKNDYSDLFFKQASFCLEIYNKDLFRLESMSSPNYFVNHHSLSDQSLYLIKNNPSDALKTTFSFYINQLDFGPRDYTITIDKSGKTVNYHFDSKRNLFVRQKNMKTKIVLTKKIDYHFDSEVLNQLDCYLLSKKHKLYYHANQLTDDGSLKFQIDPENSLLLDQLECNVPQSKADQIQILCNPNIEPIHFEQDCTLTITKKAETTVLLPKKWKIVNYLSKKDIPDIIEDDALELIYIRFKSIHHKMSKKIDYCYIQAGQHEFRYTESLVQDKKLFLSFEVPKSALRYPATFQCLLEADNDRLEGYFQCQLTINKQSEIIAEDCRA